MLRRPRFPANLLGDTTVVGTERSVEPEREFEQQLDR
jgi:hypothetical protein